MRTGVIFNFLGGFLQVFAILLLLPVFVGAFYSEPLDVVAGFIFASAASLFIGLVLRRLGDTGNPSTNEAMMSTVLGWVIAVILGAIPFMTHVGDLGILNTLFESAAGLTTTGISMLDNPENLEKSLLFWRSFMQWIGGLGVLTFFIAIVRESGGVSRRLFSAESHKTDPGSIRPSLTKSVIVLWKVYGFLTTVIVAVYMLLGLDSFNAIIHAFSGISTGGFSSISGSVGGFGSSSVELFTVSVMFVGGVNFVLLYRVLRGRPGSLLKNSEFRLYSKIFLFIAALMLLELVLSGDPVEQSLVDSLFQSASVVSSTGYSTMSIMTLSVFLQAVFIVIMFVGGSLGSTTGGVKVFRLKTMVELAKTHLKSYTLPDSAVNKVEIDGEILDRDVIRSVVTIFFLWISFTVFLSVSGVILEDVTLIQSLSGAVSSLGNMGPVYMSGEEMIGLNPLLKVFWMFAMLAGRLEMIPLLAIFNRELFKDST